MILLVFWRARVADCALLAGAVSGRDLGDPEVRPAGAPRIGLCRSPSWDLAGPETAALLDAGRSGAGAGRRRGLRPGVAGGVLGTGAGAPDRHEQRERPGAGLGAGDGARRDQPRAAGAAGIRAGVQRGGADGGAARCSTSTRRAFPAAMEGLDVLVTPSAPGRGAGRAGLDRRPGVQLHLDQPARALRDGAGWDGAERAAAGHPDRRAAGRGPGGAGLGAVGGCGGGVSTGRVARGEVAAARPVVSEDRTGGGGSLFRADATEMYAGGVSFRSGSSRIASIVQTPTASEK